MRPRVIYWNNIPAPYMVDRFNAIARRSAFDFEAWFSAQTESDRSWVVDEDSWQFRFRYLPQLKLGAWRFALPAPVVTKPHPDVLVGLHAEPGFLVGQELARRYGTRIVLWLIPTYDSWVRRRPWKELVKRSFFPHVHAVFTTGPDGVAIAERYGVSRERISVVHHGIDCRHLVAQLNGAASRRDVIREELGIRGIAFLYVGRLWSGKGLDYLIDAFATVRDRIPTDTTLVLAGDGPEEGRLRRRCHDEGLNVVFPGFYQRDQLARIYASADVFVFPTLGDPFGHVVEEAMSCGLPVISTSAAGEIRTRIDDQHDGFIVPPADSRTLADRMEALARSETLRTAFGQAAADRAAGSTTDRWAREFEDAVNAVLELP